MNQTAPQPALYGLANSNRDFAHSKNWGKNIFNNAFPVALACYMDAKTILPVYFTLNDQRQLNRGVIPVDQLFGIAPTSPDAFYAFESDFIPYQPLVIGNLPRADLVVIEQTTGLCTSALEIKLTALPDNSTFNFPEERYGCELVVRPDTIVYLALSIAAEFKSAPDQLLRVFQPFSRIANWSDIAEVAPMIAQMAAALDQFMTNNLHLQQPLVMQPI